MYLFELQFCPNIWPGVRLYGSSIFRFLRNLHTDLHSDLHLHSHQQWRRIWHCPTQILPEVSHCTWDNIPNPAWPGPVCFSCCTSCPLSIPWMVLPRPRLCMLHAMLAMVFPQPSSMIPLHQPLQVLAQIFKIALSKESLPQHTCFPTKWNSMISVCRLHENVIIYLSSIFFARL